MKTFVSCFFLLVITFTCWSQRESSISLIQIEQVGNTIEITFESDRNFIVGANPYVLHIGADHFMRSKHPEGNELKLTFLLTTEEFHALEDGQEMTLVYGYYHSNPKKDNQAKKVFSGLHWQVGNMNKGLLKD